LISAGRAEPMADRLLRDRARSPIERNALLTLATVEK
jgi:hypothetical protein